MVANPTNQPSQPTSKMTSRPKSKGVPRSTAKTGSKTGSNRLLKGGVGLILLTLLGFLFMRTVRGTRAEPYTIPPDGMGPWTLAFEPGDRPQDPILVWRPPAGLTGGLFGQLFKRAMESMSAPAVSGMPLVLASELAHAQARHPALTREVLMTAAREAGLDRMPPQPRCMAHRRAQGGGDREQLYFVLFDPAAFGRFRQRIGAVLNDGVTPARDFDPALLPPALMLALVESTTERWLPMRADPAADCVAPILLAPAPPG
jgi:hypothetical protein